MHTVAGTTYLVSPACSSATRRSTFKSPRWQAGEAGGWQWVQKRFEKLGQHRKQPSGLNIWTCEVTGPRKSRRLRYLLASPEALFRETPPDSPYLRLLNEAAKREDSALWGKDNDDQGGRATAVRAASICGWGRLCQLGFGQSHQVGGTAFQRTGNLEDEGAWAHARRADLAHVRPFDAGHVGQRFLSYALVGSFFPHGSPKRDGWFRFVGSGAGGAALWIERFGIAKSVEHGHDLNHVKLNSSNGFEISCHEFTAGELDVESSDITAEIRMAVGAGRKLTI